MFVIVFSNLPPPTHGVSVYNVHLLEQLNRRGVRHRVIRVGSNSNLGSLTRWSASKILGDLLAHFTLVSTLLKKRWQRQSPTVIYFTPSQGGPAILRDALVVVVARLLRVPLVAHLHGCGWLGPADSSRAQSVVKTWILKSSAVLLCLGQRYATKLKASLGVPTVPVNNGAPDHGITQSRSGPDGHLPLRLLFLSNFVPGKGLETAARAVRIIRSAGRPCVLTCAGQWPSEHLRSRFEFEFADLIGDGYIRFTGLVSGSDKDRLLRDADMLLLPTRILEGQPLVIIEAMSYGVPPITTDQGGIPDLFEPPWGDRLSRSDHDDPRKLAETVLSIAATPAEYQELSSHCLKLFRERLTTSISVDRVLTVISAVAVR